MKRRRAAQRCDKYPQNMAPPRPRA